VLIQFYDQMDHRLNRLLEAAATIGERAGCSNVRTEAVPEFDSVLKQVLDQSVCKTVDFYPNARFGQL
jgi:hypothetical protein